MKRENTTQKEREQYYRKLYPKATEYCIELLAK